MISIVVCTYNRADILRIALESLCRQTLDKMEYEVIVVDNNSTDETPQAVREFEHHGNVRYILETEQGNSQARNRGWQEARGEYIGFIDDDCKVPEQWLSIAHRIVTERAPDAFGGPYYPYYLTPKPHWFRDEYGTSLHSLPMNRSGNLPEGKYLPGGNMFFQRRLLEESGGFDPEFGIKGIEERRNGEDTLLQVYMYEHVPNFAIYYDLECYVYHLVKPLRMDLLRLISFNFKLGRDHYVLFEGDRPIRYKPLVFVARQGFVTMRLFAQIVWDGVTAALLRDRKTYPYWQNYIYENAVPRFMLLGIVYERFRLYWQRRRQN